jgi:sugar lactone lactonase YvrE
MTKPFTTLIIFSLGAILVSTSAHAAGALAIDGAGNLFVADYSSQKIFKFTPEGKKSTFSSGIGPDKMAVDGAGNLFAADYSSQKIFKFTPEGTKSTFASGTPVSGTPVYLALDGAGNLFVAWGGESILKFTPDGKNSMFASGDNHGDMAVDGAGNLFVVEGVRAAGSTILKFTPDGKKSTFAPGLSTLDYGVHNLTFDDKGNLFVSVYGYVGDAGSSILKFTPDGKKSTVASGLAPKDLAFDRSGNLVVMQEVSPSILKFTPDGKKSTLATGIRLDGMALDAAGNLFVLEDGSDLIFKFTPDGTRSTFVSDRVSPDKQWEYQCSAHGYDPRILRTGTSQTVLDLSKQVPEFGNDAKIVWAPDSKRFALNYTEGARARTSPTALYQLRGEKWVALRSPETDETTKPVEQAQFDQFRKMQLPIPGHKLWNDKKVLRWIDSSTALLYSGMGVMGNDDSWPETGFLFTLKFNKSGNWKIIKTHQMSKKELEEER